MANRLGNDPNRRVDLGRRANGWQRPTQLFNFYLQHFSRWEDAPFAKDASQVLQQMIAANAAHKTPPPDAPMQEKINELVYQLQDQEGYQWITLGTATCLRTIDPAGVQPTTLSHWETPLFRP